MAINPMNFSGAGDLSTGVPEFGKIFENMAQGYQLSQLPEETRLKQALMGAQANQANAIANLGGLGQFSGASKDALGLQLLKSQYGENSPVYQNALRAYNQEYESQNVLDDYRRSLADTADKRSSSTLGKMQIEREDIANDPNISPGLKQQRLAQYDLKVLKDGTDPKSRERVLFATNLDKTLDALNLDDLTVYGGAKGQMQNKVDMFAAAANKPNERYIKHQEALTAAKLLAKQIRQFYGDSITPGVQEALNEMTNPATWQVDQKTAKAKFNKLKNILLSETKTYRDALKGTDVYSDSDAFADQMMGQIQKNSPEAFGGNKNSDPLGLGI